MNGQEGMNIKVLAIRLQNSSSKSLKGFADIELDNGLIIKDFRILQEPNQRAFIVAPQTSWRGPGGQIQFKTILTIPNGLKWEIESPILAEYQKVQGERDGKSQS